MAPLTKKQPQSHQHHQQQTPADNVRRPNIWRFISVRRFGSRSRRDSAEEDEDRVRPAALSNSFYDESDDDSDPVLFNDDAPDDESVCSQYTDARSNWDHSVTNREDAMSFAFSELLQSETQQDDGPSHAGSLLSNSKHRTHGDVRRPDSSRTINATTDAVVNFHGLENQFDAYFARPSPSVPFSSSAQMAIDPFSTASPPLQQSSRHQDAFSQDVFSFPKKGKNIQTSPDWSSATNPWASLQHDVSGSDDRETLMTENARLQAEIRDLKAMAANNTTPTARRRSAVESPARSPAARTPSRLRRPKNKKRQDVTLFETTTLRDLVLKRLFTPHVIVDGIIHDEEQPLSLDTPLTSSQVQDFTRIMNEVIVSGSHLKQPIALCAVCHLPKFKGIKTMHQNSYVSEVLAQLPMVSGSAFEDFDPALGTSACCRRYVCKTCLSAAIISGIGAHWWLDLQNREANWLKCPVPCCGRSLPLYSRDEVAEVMQRLGIHNALPHLERYDRGTRLRSQMQQLDPLPGKDETRRSKALHDRLVRHRRMRPLLEELPDAGNDEAYAVECLPIDTPDGRGTLMIPIFKRLLFNRTPRTCLVCDETHDEFRAGNSENWNRMIKGLGGEWTWRILAFPNLEVLPDCQHDHSICRSCLAQYVTTQVESQGHSVVDNIVCPTPNCRHIFNHGEVRRLATPGAFALYDRYTVLNSISSQSNFRWCLREGCVAGSLYDDPTTAELEPDSNGVDPNCIECSECHFTMCFACQSPWHADLTCAQHTSQHAHSFTETVTWLAEHTKPCPGEGCGVQVQKGDGCFHMTCSRCHFEFCWECLADWRGIFVPNGEDGGGLLRADGHREGCYFRGEGAPLPTQVMGQDLEAGLRRLEQRADQAAVEAG